MNGDLKIVFHHVFVSILVISISVIFSQPTFAQPDAIQIMRELKNTKPQKHAPIYRKILEDKSVLSHPALLRHLVKLADEVWYERWLRGNIFKRENASPLKVKDEGSYPPARNSFINFSEVSLHLEKENFVRVWLKIIPGRFLEVPEEVFYRLKKNTPIFAKVFLENSMFEEDSNENEEYRYMVSTGGSGYKLCRALYEGLRKLKEDENQSVELSQRMDKFTNEAILSNEDISIIKILAISYLLDHNQDESKLRKNLVQVPHNNLSSSTIRESIFVEANKWRSEYPKWPVDESRIDDDRHRNEKGKGHDKQKGEGH